MSYSYQEHTTDATTLTYSFSLAGDSPGYINTAHIVVYVRASGSDTWTELTTDKWVLSGTNQVVLASAIAYPDDGESNLRIRRVVPKEVPYASFPRGSMLDMLNLQRTFIQGLEATQELLDGFLPDDFYYKQNVNMNGHKFINLGKGTASGDSVNYDQWLDHENRVVALETDLTGVSTRTIAYYYIATGGEVRWDIPSREFNSAIMFINGIFQNQNLGAFSITNNGFNFAEPLEKGDQVYVLVGSSIADPDNHPTFTELSSLMGAKMLGYQVDTGVLRTVHEKLTDTLSVKDTGAKGDFSTDDTTAILLAMAIASAYSDRGMVVEFPGGIYNVSRTITVPQHVSVRGAGRFTTMLRCTVTGAVANPILLMEAGYSDLSDMTVGYGTMQNVVGACIRSTGPSNKLTGFRVVGGYLGVEWYNGSATVMTNFLIEDCKYAGLKLGKDNTSFSNDLILSNFFIVTGDSLNFQIGGIRVVGQVEALFASKFDIIGGVMPFSSDPGGTPGLRFSRITDGFFDSGTNSAQFYGVNNSYLSNLWFSNRAVGALFSGCFNLHINAQAYNNDYQGVIFTGACKKIIFTGILGNNNIKASDGIQDVYVSGECADIIIKDIVGDESGSTDYLVLVENGATNITLRDISATPRASGVVSLGTSTPGVVVDNVRGFVTKNRGSAALGAGATSMTVSHGLSITPSLKHLTLQLNSQTAYPLYISDVTATQFTVRTQGPNTGDSAYSWVADVSQ